MDMRNLFPQAQQPTAQQQEDFVLKPGNMRVKDLPGRPLPQLQGFDSVAPWFPLPEPKQDTGTAKHVVKRIAAVVSPLIGLTLTVGIIVYTVFQVARFYS